MNVAMGVLCGVCFLAAVFFCFFAVASFFYPQSRTTVEVYPTDVRAPRRWTPIFAQLGLSLLTAGAGTAIFAIVFMPEISAKVRNTQLLEAEELTRTTFVSKLKREPLKMSFDDDPRNSLQRILQSGWEINGVASFEHGETWDVNVKKTGTELKCVAQRRE